MVFKERLNRRTGGVNVYAKELGASPSSAIKGMRILRERGVELPADEREQVKVAIDAYHDVYGFGGKFGSKMKTDLE